MKDQSNNKTDKAKNAIAEKISPYSGDIAKHRNNLINGSQLQALVRTRLRPGIYKKIESKLGADQATDLWQHMFDQIVKAHYFFRYPKLYGQVINAELAKQIKEDYLFEFNFLSGISDRLEKGDTVRQIALSIDSHALID